MKKVLSLMLAIIMALSMFTGCGRTDESSESNKGTSVEEVSKEKTELTTVRILCNNDYSADIKTEDWEKYPVSKVFIQDLEEIGIRLELECIDSASFADVVKTRMASGTDLPDLIPWIWQDEGLALEWASSGLIYPINELVEQYDTDGSIKAYYDEKATGAWEKNTAADGNIYWFSYLCGAKEFVDAETGTVYNPADAHVLAVRKDWVEAVGEELKLVYTPDEFYNLLKKMYDQDANGNGTSDEIFYANINNFANGIATGFGMSESLLVGYFEEDNQVFSNFYHENFPAYIDYMKKLYESGVYDTEVLSAGYSDMISADRVSAIRDYAETTADNSLPYIENDGVGYIPVLLDMDGNVDNGYTIVVDNYEVTTYGQYFIPKASENVEAVMRLMDYVYSDKYVMLTQYGLEGLGHELDENGNIINQTVPGTDATHLGGTGLGMYALPMMLCIYPNVEPQYHESNPQYLVEKEIWAYNFQSEIFPKAENVEYSSKFLSMPTDEENEFVSEKLEVLKTYASELLVDLILGEKSMDDYDTYLKELEDLGLKEYIDVIQAQRDRIVGK